MTGPTLCRAQPSWDLPDGTREQQDRVCARVRENLIWFALNPAASYDRDTVAELILCPPERIEAAKVYDGPLIDDAKPARNLTPDEHGRFVRKDVARSMLGFANVDDLVAAFLASCGVDTVDDLETLADIAADEMVSLIDRTEAAHSPFENLLTALGMLPPYIDGIDYEDPHHPTVTARLSMCDAAYRSVRTELYEFLRGAIMRAVATLQAKRRHHANG